MNNLDELQKILEAQKQPSQEQMRMPASEPVQPEPAPEQPAPQGLLEGALEQRNKQRMYADMLGSFQQMIAAGAAGTGYKADMSVANNLRKDANDPVNEYNAKVASDKADKKEEREGQLDKIKIGKATYEFTNLEKTDDPASEESKLAQDIYIRNMKEMGKPVDETKIRNIPATVLHANSKPIQEELNRIFKGRQAELDRDSKSKTDDTSQRKMDQKDRHLNILESRETGKDSRYKRGQDWREIEKDELSDKQAELLGGYEQSMDLMKEALRLKKGKGTKGSTDTGPLVSASDSVRSVFGSQDPDVSDLKMVLGENLAAKVKTLSGTAASDTERAFIDSISLPSIGDNDAVFERKLERAMKTLEMAKKERVETFRKQGKDPSAFDDNAMVLMESPDGDQMRVKKDKVDKYIKKGAKVVE